MVLAAVWILVPGVVASAAQPKGQHNNALNNQKKDVQAARDRLQAERKQAEGARAEAVRAGAALKNAEQHAKHVRESVQAEHDSSSALVAARAKWEQDKQALAQLSEPLLAKVREQSPYQAAVAARDAAKAAGQPRQFSDAVALIKKLETGAIEANPQARAALALANESETKLQELVKVRDEVIAKDKRFLDAKQAIDKTRAAVASAQQKAMAEQRQLAAAEDRLQKEEREKRALEQRAREKNAAKKKR
jgi:chromosome segregation ATPase